MTNFIGTRGCSKKKTHVRFSDAILNPSASFGGIYVPEVIPSYDYNDLEKLLTCSYEDTALFILKSFGIDISDSDILKSLKSYNNFDNPDCPVPVSTINDTTFVSELWHGPTRAFKDMALQPFPQILSSLAVKKNKKYIILAATSGDTGPAALSGFRNLPNTKVVCFYPEGGTSHIQKEQMVKESGENLKVIGINGNFDDTQTALKHMISSEDFKEELHKKGYELSAANSVNFGRIIFQIVYHFWSYFELVLAGDIEFEDEIISIIPSGNFGNGLAAYYAKLMGLPIKKIVLASNENNVLTEFIKTGIYDLNIRELIHTTSPAMDILKSSNIERLLYHLFGSTRTKELMTNFEQYNYFILLEKERLIITNLFFADSATDNEVSNMIKKTYDDYDYIIDPHTATAFVARGKISLKQKCIIASTAEWTKFPETMGVVFNTDNGFDELTAMFGEKLSDSISILHNMPINHELVIEKYNMESEILKFV